MTFVSRFSKERSKNPNNTLARGGTRRARYSGMKTIVEIQKVYADGSGAPATIVCRGYYFAADFIGGEVSLTGLTGRSVPRRVCVAAQRAYAQELRQHVDVSAAWYDANRAMYAADKNVGCPYDTRMAT